MKALKIAIFAVLLAPLIFLIADFESFLPEEAALDKADAVIVLSGAAGRLQEGIKLLDNEKADIMLFLGAGKTTTVEALLKQAGIEDVSRYKNKIVIENLSTTTYENALKGAEMVEKLKLNSIILLTSNYHLTRAYLLFSKIMDKKIKIYPYGVRSVNFNKNQWWTNLTSFSIYLSEFFKYSVFRIYLVFA